MLGAGSSACHWRMSGISRHAARRILSPRHTPPSFRPHRRAFSEQPPRPNNDGSFTSRLRAALAATEIRWTRIPLGVGIAFLGVFQLYRLRRRDRDDAHCIRYEDDVDELDKQGRPRKRKRIRPSGPWQVQIMSTLPLKAMSRIWGRLNELNIPYYLRVPGFKLYSLIFGVNLSEVAEPDLRVYPNLASFFYRQLRPGVRPLDPNPNAVLSPADGKIIQFGIIDRGEVEQVKGVTYTLDALLGAQSPKSRDGKSTSNIAWSLNSAQPSESRSRSGDEEIVRADEEFAQVNGISYTLPNLFSGPDHSDDDDDDDDGVDNNQATQDQSTTSHAPSEAEVHAELALGDYRAKQPWWSPTPSPKTPTALYYLVVYLAPGDYHRFHSPVSWVVQARRHFAGELYSVSPYLQRTLPGLFTLNERVVLLGRWRWGFFSYTPVGATNVGSMKINFDRELSTNSLTTDTAADRAAERAAMRGEPYSGFAEATYDGASALLHGHALRRGEEMGGFQLGSTIVMVFEAPKGHRPSFDQGFKGEGGADERRGGFRWNVEKGQQVKYGQAIGWVEE